MTELRAGLLLVLTCAITACSVDRQSPTPGTPTVTAPRYVVPDVTQKGKGAQWVQFLPHTPGALYSAIVQGPDENMWFLDENAAGLVRMTLSGAIKEFSLSAFLGGNAVAMAVGADDKFYIGDETASVTRVTTHGAAQVIPIPSGDNTAIDGIAPGPDGNVWFA
jgi:streptogramin lyase